MNYPYFGQTGQGATSGPPSNQPTNVQQVAPPQQNPQFLMNNQQFQGNQMGQPLFPQPTGSVYNLNTASDIGNVPAGVGISVGLCLQENVMYIKALQNGSPMLLGYRLSPIEGSASSGAAPSVVPTEETEELIKENKRLVEVLKGHDEKIQMIENQLAKMKDRIGDKSEWQL